MAKSIDELPNPLARRQLPNPLDPDYEKPSAAGGAIKRVGGNLARSAGQALEDVGVSNRIDEFGEQVLRDNPQYATSVGEFARNPVAGTTEILADTATQAGLAAGGGYTGRKVGQALGGIAGGIVGRGPGAKVGAKVGGNIGELVGGTGPLALQPYGGIRAGQEEQGLDDPGRAAAASLAAGAIERFAGPERLAGSLVGKATPTRAPGVSRVQSGMQEAARSALAEAPTEVMQSAIERAGAFQDLGSEEALGDYAFSALAGAVGGAGIGGPLGALKPEAQPAPQLPPDDQEGPPGTAEGGPSPSPPPASPRGAQTNQGFPEPGPPGKPNVRPPRGPNARLDDEGFDGYTFEGNAGRERQSRKGSFTYRPDPLLPAPGQSSRSDQFTATPGGTVIDDESMRRFEEMQRTDTEARARAQAQEQRRLAEIGLTPDVLEAQRRRQGAAQNLQAQAMAPDAGPLTKAVGNNVDNTSLGAVSGIAPPEDGPDALESSLRGRPPEDQDPFEADQEANYQRALQYPVDPERGAEMQQLLSDRGVEADVLPHPNREGAVMVVPRRMREDEQQAGDKDTVQAEDRPAQTQGQLQVVQTVKGEPYKSEKMVRARIRQLKLNPDDYEVQGDAQNGYRALLRAPDPDNQEQANAQETDAPRALEAPVAEERQEDTQSEAQRPAAPRPEVAEPAADEGPQLVEVKTVYGDTERVDKRDLDNPEKPQLRRYTKSGEKKAGGHLARANIASSDEDIRKANEGLPTIEAKGGKGYKSEKMVRARIKQMRLDPADYTIEGDAERGYRGVRNDLRADSTVADTTTEQPELVEHVTKKGKRLRGVVRTDMTRDQAKAVDPYTFKKDGGYFIREQHLSKLDSDAAPSPTETDRAQDQPDTGRSTETGERWQPVGANMSRGAANEVLQPGTRVRNDKGITGRVIGRDGDATRWQDDDGIGHITDGRALEYDAIAPAPSPAAAQSAPKQAEQQSREIGQNQDGQTIFEDANGVRFYTEDGATVREPAQVSPRGETTPRSRERRADTRFEATNEARSRRRQEGSYTLTDARNDLIDLRTQAERQGSVADDRLLSRVRQQEQLVRDMGREEGTADPARPSGPRVTVREIGPDGLTAQERAERDAQAADPEAEPEAEPAADQTAQAEPDPARPEPSANTVFTEDAAARARARIRSKLNNLNTGVDPELLQDGIVLAGYHIERGARSFAAYARAMVGDLGEAVKPYLKSWYMGVKYDPRAEGWDGLSTPAEVDSTDVDAILQEAGDAARSVDSPSAEALEGAPAEGVQADAGGSDAREGAADSSAADIGRDADARGSGSQPTGRVGDGSRAAPVPTGGTGQQPREPRQQRVPDDGKLRPVDEQPADPGPGGLAPNATPPASPSFDATDFVIGDDLALGEGGQKTKFKNNVAAIRLLKTLEREGRTATPAEQQTLALYVGWGGLPQAFDADNAQWSREHQELRELLTEGEYETARQSTRYAHYTSREIIGGMYGALRRLGFTGGRVLEPGSGVGHFIGLMPADLKTASRFTGVERENIAAGIAKQLYPQQSIQQADFAAFNAPNGYFDAIIGNPPFASTSLTDQSGRKHLSGLSIHNYFFAKSVDQLREGGLLAMVVSNSFLDARKDTARQYIADRTRFLGAIRLPNNAFSKNANTEVTTDVIFLQKRPESEWGSQQAKQDGRAWLDMVTVTDPRGGEKLGLNTYFANNPSMMLGQWGRYGTMYGPDQPALVADEGQDTQLRMEGAIRTLPENVYTVTAEAASAELADQTVEKLKNPTVDVGGFFVEDGELRQRLDDAAGEARARVLTPRTMWTAKTKLGDKGHDKLVRLAELRKTMRSLIAAEINGDEQSMSTLRPQLNERYDAYLKKHGYINAPGTARVFDDDPDYPLLAALEVDYQPALKEGGKTVQKQSARKAPIFSQRVVEARQAVRKADNPEDALNISIAERGQIDRKYIAELLGRRDADAVLNELVDSELLFRDPATDEYVLRDEYLSGNVRAKLEQAKQAGAYANAAALEAVVPEDVGAHEISARIGSPWVPTRVYEDFARDLFGEGTRANVRYIKQNSSYASVIRAGSDTAAHNAWGTDAVPGPDILGKLLNNKDIKVRRKDGQGNTYVDVEATENANIKAQEMRDRFQDWLFSDPDRSELLVRAYNDTNNNYVTRQFDGSWLSFPGKVPDSDIQLRQHQANAVARIVQKRTGLLDHVVGSGKTFTVIASAMELKRTGLANKPMIAVPNHLVNQWAADFYRLYPGARVLTASKKDFERKNRRRFLAKIATGDWDAVVIAHSSFGFIRPDQEFETQFNKQLIADIISTIEEMKREQGDDLTKKRTIKQLEGMKETLDNHIKSLREKPLDNLLDFKEIGVDQLFIDEAHLFKNLFFTTKMQNVQGLGDPKGSQRAYDMYLKVRQLYEQNGRGQGVVFATGTPVSNSLAEMYHMMRYLMPETMAELGFQSFDAWANTFAAVQQEFLQKPAGNDFKAVNKMSTFVNTHELLKVFDQVADTVTNDQLTRDFRERNGRDFPIPPVKGGRRTPVSLEKTEAQDAYMDKIAARSEAVERRKGPPQKGDDNILTIMTDARKAAMDIRLVDPTVREREPGARIDQAANNIVERHQRWSEQRGTQLVFSDLGTPIKQAAKELREYNELQERIQKAADEDVQNRANLGNESALAIIEDSEKAQAELDEKGPDWKGAVDAALRGFSVYDDMKAALIERGIPESEIAFIHDYNTDAQKAKLFQEVNEGRIRVLMGSTPKMGAGTNVQQRLVAEHHLDVPWRPSDVEQREGRIIRQGNKLFEGPEAVPGFEVEILAYVTKDTLDMRMWQIQESKIKMINQLRSREITRDFDNAFEEMEMSAGEMQAAATGNPELLEEVMLRKELKDLDRRKRSFEAQKNDSINRLRRARETVERGDAEVRRAEALAEAAAEYEQQRDAAFEGFDVTINGTRYTDDAEAAEAIGELIEARETDEDGKERKAALNVEFNGQTYTNRTKLTEAFAEMRGDTSPILWTHDGQQMRRRKNIQQAIQQAVADAIAEENTQALGSMGPAEVRVEGQSSKAFGRMMEVTVSANGVDAAAVIGVPESGSDDALAQTMAMRIIKAADNLITQAEAVLAQKRNKIGSARRQINELGDFNPDKQWPDQDKLEQARARHAELLQKLKGDAEQRQKAKTAQQEEGGGDIQEDRAARAETNGYSVDQARAILRRRFGRGFDDLERAGIISLIGGPNDYPAEHAAYLKKVSGKARIKGFYDRDRGAAYVLPRNFESEDALVRTVLHEIGEHYGLKTMLGDDAYQRLIQQVKRLSNGNPLLRAAKEEVDALYSHLDKNSDRYWSEVIAKAGSRPEALDQAWFQQIIQAIRRFLFKNNLVSMRLNDADIAGMLVASVHQSMARAGEAIREGDDVALADTAIAGTLAFHLDDPPNTLTPGQKEQVRSDAFKRWFGEWEDAGRAGRRDNGDAAGNPARGNAGAEQAGRPDRRRLVSDDSPDDGSRRTQPRVAQADVGASGWRLGDGGEPRVFYHGSRADIQSFDLAHADRKDHGWLGDGVYLTSSPSLAWAYANAKKGGDGPNLMPLFTNVRNPYRATEDFKQTLRRRPQEAKRFTEWAKQRGYDGVLLQSAGGTMEVVAFEPTQVKSAIANRGTFDGNDPRIDFDLSAPNDSIGRVSEQARKLPQATKEEFDNLAADGRPSWLKLLTRQQIVDVGKEQFDTTEGNLAREFEQFARRIEADTNNEIERPVGDGRRSYGEIAKAWSRMAGLGGDKQAAARMAAIMHDATIEGIDPAEPPGNADPTRYNELRRRYEELPEEARQLYLDVRDAYAKRRQDFMDALKKRIEESAADGNTKRAMMASLRTQFESGQVQGAYFPLARFGDFYVVAEDADGNREFLLAETQRKQQLEASRLKAEGYTVRTGKNIKDLASEMGRPGSQSQFLVDIVGLVDSEIGEGPEAEALKDGLWQMYLQALPEMSVRKRFIHRKGTPGFSQDALRAFSSHIGHGSKQLARLRYAHKLADSLNRMKAHAPKAPDPNKAADIVGALNSSYEWIMNPNNATWANRLTSLGFTWYLGLTPAAAAVNLTQLPIVTLPVLGARHGMAKSAGALSKAMKDYLPTTFNKERRATLERERNGDLGRMMKELEESGAISRTLSMSLMGMSDTNTVVPHGTMDRAMNIIGGMFHGAEVMNREVTAIAAYRLARDAGSSHEQATQSAYDAIFESHFDYSSSNRAEFMRGNVARVILLFKQYSQNMTYFLARNFQQSFRGASKEERRAAATKLMGTLSMTAAFSGTMGLPLVGAVMSMGRMLEGMFGDDDDPWDIEAAYRKWLNDNLGATAGNVVARGAMNELTGADVATRTSLQELWVRRPSRELEGTALAQHYLGEALGPVVGIGMDWFTAAQYFAEGRFQRGVERALPKFIRDPSKTLRFAEEGALNFRGDPIIKEFTAGELFMQSVGLSPAELIEQYDKNNALKRVETRIQRRRRALMNLYAEASNAGDQEMLRETMRKIEGYNKSQPRYPITNDSLRQSLRSRERYSQRVVGGVGLNPKLRDQLLEDYSW